MIIRAARPEANFVMVRNAVARDERLSFRARGVLVAILSRPDDWSISAANLAREGQESVGTIYKVLKELEEAGYVERRRVRDKSGHIRTQTLVFDQSCSPTTKKPIDGEPNDGLPMNGETDSRFSSSDTKTELQKQKTKTVKKKPPSPNVAVAQSICNDWWERQDRIVGKYEAIYMIVLRILDAGWEPEIVARSLDHFVTIPTSAALQLQMKGKRGLQTKYDRNRQVLEQSLQQQKNHAIRLAFDALEKGKEDE